MNTTMEKAAAQVLLDRGVGFKIPAPLFYRIFGKKAVTINVKRLRLGTLLHISELIPAEELEKPETLKERENVIREMGSELTSLKLEYIRKHSTDTCKAVACALLNSKWKIKLLSPVLGRYLMWKCTPDQLQELTLWVFAYGRMESFMNTTKLLQTMKMTSQRNLGQQEERS